MSCLDLIFASEFACVLSLLEPVDFHTLSLISSHLQTQTSVLYRNQRYWKQRFERQISYTFSVDQDPGRTTWLWKYRRILIHDFLADPKNPLPHPLLLSPEIFDVKLAVEFGWIPKTPRGKCKAIGRIIAAPNCNEEVIRFLAPIPQLKMSKCMMARSVLDEISHHASTKLLGILLDPELSLGIDIRELLPDAEDDSEVQTFLLEHPSARIAEKVDDYIGIALNNTKPQMLTTLLDRPDAKVSRETVQGYYAVLTTRRRDNAADEMLCLLASHPKTCDKLH